MNGRDFQQVAKELIRDSLEASWRSAVSRSYYAAFHVARELLESLGFAVPRGERAHAYLWLRLSNCGNDDIQNAGRGLNDLRGERNRADYDLHKVLTSLTAAKQVKDAERIIQALDSADLVSVRGQITEAMKTYEHEILKETTWLE